MFERSLTVDPIALKHFFDKAQRLRPKESTTSTDHLDLASTDANALLAFAHNEQELTHLRQRIQEMEEKLQQLDSSDTEKQFKDEHRKVNERENQQRNPGTFSCERRIPFFSGRESSVYLSSPLTYSDRHMHTQSIPTHSRSA